MREYPLRVLEARVTKSCSLHSIDYFIEGRAHVSERERHPPWLSAWSESARENRLRRVAELIEGERHLAGRVDANARFDPNGADDESVGEHNHLELGVGP
jgi:hypothetical protein